jgi:hypothetical protein
MSWNPIKTRWYSNIPDYPHLEALPGLLGTPVNEWQYGAATEPVHIKEKGRLRLHAQAIEGVIGFCLVTEDYSGLAAPQQLNLRPEQGDGVVEFDVSPEKSPLRIVVRNNGDQGTAGRVFIGSASFYVPSVDKRAARR